MKISVFEIHNYFIIPVRVVDLESDTQFLCHNEIS